MNISRFEFAIGIIAVIIIIILVGCAKMCIADCINEHREQRRDKLLLDYLDDHAKHNRELSKLLASRINAGTTTSGTHTQVPDVGNVRNIATMTDDIEIAIETTSTTIKNLGLKEVITIRSKDIPDHV